MHVSPHPHAQLLVRRVGGSLYHYGALLIELSRLCTSVHLMLTSTSHSLLHNVPLLLSHDGQHVVEAGVTQVSTGWFGGQLPPAVAAMLDATAHGKGGVGVLRGGVVAAGLGRGGEGCCAELRCVIRMRMVGWGGARRSATCAGD